MTLPIGAIVKINPSGNYPTQGKVEGVFVIGKVVQNKYDKDWVENWGSMGFDVKVRWPYQKNDKYSLYKSDRDLIGQTCHKTLQEFL